MAEKISDLLDGRAHSGVCSASEQHSLDVSRAIEQGRPFGILCATWGETIPFLRYMDVRAEVCCGPRSFFEGVFAGCEVVVACAGVGKVNAAMATQQLVDSYAVAGIFNAGAAGAADSSLELFDIVVSSACMHHDVPDFVLCDSYPYYASQEFASDATLLAAAHAASKTWRKPFVFGCTATGECFVDDSNREAIVASCSPLAVDMETAAMAQTCEANKIPFIAVRCITDTPALSGFDSYAKNADEASEYACRAVEFVLHALVEGE